VTIWERIKTAISGLGLATAANTMIVASGASLPEAYLVYQLISAPALQSADDVEKLSWQRVQVSYFSRAGLAGMPDVTAAMLAAGFRRMESRELPYSRETRHYGLAMDFGYVEMV